MKIELLKSSKGITLIALVITIIILIILAGVSINILFDNDGLIEKAKKAAENMEIAQVEEQEMLNTLLDSVENLGQIKTVKEMRTSGTYMNKTTTLKDSDNNLIKVPEGFKIASDSGINVTEGIVIEDNDIKEGIGNNRGNQYVWIPVGENIKKSDGTEVDITLGRYVFADGTNHKDEDGNTIVKGTPILKQSGDNYADETGITAKEINPTLTQDWECKELKINREGKVSSGLDGSNATALNLKGFIDSVKANGGYYIARFEASYGTDGKANSKVSTGTPSTSSGAQYAPTEEGYLWNNVTQVDAAKASKGLYEKVATDLINSYAWDTAILYIQEFSEDKDYSMQISINSGSTPSNTGINNDELCKIHDMASNANEWTTEYYTYVDASVVRPCIYRGGVFTTTERYTSYRGAYQSAPSNNNGSFRYILYI